MNEFVHAFILGSIAYLVLSLRFQGEFSRSWNNIKGSNLQISNLKSVGLTPNPVDDEISSGRMSLAKGSEFQARLDSVRSDYLRITEGARSATNEEKEEISRRLDSLETDLNHLPQL